MSDEQRLLDRARICPFCIDDHQPCPYETEALMDLIDKFFEKESRLYESVRWRCE
jgi:hypothetical protein